MERRTLVDSFNSAIEGFIYVVKTQKNMRLHFLIAALALVVAIYLHLPRVEILILCGAVGLVLLAEMFNTAVEHTIDLFTEGFHPMARIIKDITAGAVLISAVNAIVVGYLVFSTNLSLQLEVGVAKVRQSPYHLTFISLIVVLCLVVIGKLAFHKGTPMRGGMPSGHSALVFSAWAIITFLSENAVIILLSLVMAIAVAKSRLRDNLHTPWEVIAGSMIGVLVTTFVFQLLM